MISQNPITVDDPAIREFAYQRHTVEAAGDTRPALWRTAGRSLRPRIRHPVVAAGRELAVLLALYLFYRTGRLVIASHEMIAMNNAARMHTWEAWLHLPSEALIQANLGSETLFRMANVYYVTVHFPMMITFLLVGYLLRPGPDYRWARNLIVVQTGLALLINLLFPLAPPRMFPQWGFLDTMTTYGPSAYTGATASVANQFAAMPSLHVGWAVAIAYVVARTGPRWLAIPAGIHALVTIAVVIVTANHWWLDGVVAVALLGLALIIFPEPGTVRTPGRIPQRR